MGNAENVTYTVGIKEIHGSTNLGIKWQVYTGDAISVLKELPDSIVDCVVTSPPYFWLRDYGVEGQIGLEETIDGYVQSIVDVMDELHRVMKETGVLFLNLGDTYYSGKGKSHGIDPKHKARRFGLRAQKSAESAPLSFWSPGS